MRDVSRLITFCPYGRGLLPFCMHVSLNISVSVPSDAFASLSLSDSLSLSIDLSAQYGTSPTDMKSPIVWTP